MTVPATLSAGLAPCGYDRDAADLVDVCDELDNDLVLVKAVELAVVGIGAENDCDGDANAAAELVRTLHARLTQRSEQVHGLIEADRRARRPIAV